MANWYDCYRCGKQYKEEHECDDILVLRDSLRAALQRADAEGEGEGG